jgi:hypothetical protein
LLGSGLLLLPAAALASEGALVAHGLPLDFRTCQSEFTLQPAGLFDLGYHPALQGLYTLDASASTAPAPDGSEALAQAISEKAEGPVYFVDLRPDGEAADLAAELSSYGSGETHYVRLPVPADAWPTAGTIDRFLELYRSLPRHAWVHFSDDGTWRETAFLTMYDMMRNPTVPFKSILYRDSYLGGAALACPGDATPQEVERTKMLRTFYRYVQRNQGNGYAVPWSEWLSQQG